MSCPDGRCGERQAAIVAASHDLQERLVALTEQMLDEVRETRRCACAAFEPVAQVTAGGCYPV